ncbi:TPA: hypothetical protein DIC40_02530 [Patescibacteria group bacterium]|nr:hypothetical protein P148_SR1C00001G0217 [candidate division SR1 bacterium RAAC1_SR1_1]HCY20727.1 hypothetical protein [Candidatus Gracilibacteria bacterium]
MEKIFLQSVIITLAICVAVLTLIIYKQNRKDCKFGLFATIDYFKREGYSDEKTEFIITRMTNMYLTLSPDKIRELAKTVKEMPMETILDNEKFNQALQQTK